MLPHSLQLLPDYVGYRNEIGQLQLAKRLVCTLTRFKLHFSVALELGTFALYKQTIQVVALAVIQAAA